MSDPYQAKPSGFIDVWGEQSGLPGAVRMVGFSKEASRDFLSRNGNRVASFQRGAAQAADLGAAGNVSITGSLPDGSQIVFTRLFGFDRVTIMSSEAAASAADAPDPIEMARKVNNMQLEAVDVMLDDLQKAFDSEDPFAKSPDPEVPQPSEFFERNDSQLGSVIYFPGYATDSGGLYYLNDRSKEFIYDKNIKPIFKNLKSPMQDGINGKLSKFSEKPLFATGNEYRPVRVFFGRGRNMDWDDAMSVLHRLNFQTDYYTGGELGEAGEIVAHEEWRWTVRTALNVTLAVGTGPLLINNTLFEPSGLAASDSFIPCDVFAVGGALLMSACIYPQSIVICQISLFADSSAKKYTYDAEIIYSVGGFYLATTGVMGGSIMHDVKSDGLECFVVGWNLQQELDPNPEWATATKLFTFTIEPLGGREVAVTHSEQNFPVSDGFAFSPPLTMPKGRSASGEWVTNRGTSSEDSVKEETCKIQLGGESGSFEIYIAAYYHEDQFHTIKIAYEESGGGGGTEAFASVVFADTPVQSYEVSVKREAFSFTSSIRIIFSDSRFSNIQFNSYRNDSEARYYAKGTRPYTTSLSTDLFAGDPPELTYSSSRRSVQGDFGLILPKLGIFEFQYTEFQTEISETSPKDGSRSDWSQTTSIQYRPDGGPIYKTSSTTSDYNYYPAFYAVPLPPENATEKGNDGLDPDLQAAMGFTVDTPDLSWYEYIPDVCPIKTYSDSGTFPRSLVPGRSFYGLLHLRSFGCSIIKNVNELDETPFSDSSPTIDYFLESYGPLYMSTRPYAIYAGNVGHMWALGEFPSQQGADEAFPSVQGGSSNDSFRGITGGASLVGRPLAPYGSNYADGDSGPAKYEYDDTENQKMDRFGLDHRVPFTAKPTPLGEGLGEGGEGGEGGGGGGGGE